MDRHEGIRILTEENKELYSRAGFTLPIAEKIWEENCGYWLACASIMS